MNTKSHTDKQYMAYTIELAQRGRRLGAFSERAACSVVKDGKLIASTWAGKTEKECLVQEILDELNGSLDGACVYLSQELNTDETVQPPAYVKLLVESRAIRVVVGARACNPKISNQAIQYMLDQGLEVEVGVLEREVKNLNKGLYKRYRVNMPWVCGLRCIGFDNPVRQIDFENIVLKAALEKTRSNYDAEVIVLPSSLGYSFKQGLSPVAWPDRSGQMLVIVDLGEKVGNIEKHLRQKFYKVIIYSDKLPLLLEVWPSDMDVELLLLPLDNGVVDWPALIRDLCARGLNELIIEISTANHQYLLSNNLLDEYCLFLSPYFGDEGKNFSNMKSETVDNHWIKICSRF